MKIYFIAVTAAVFGLAAPAFATSDQVAVQPISVGDPAAGEALFKKCRACHTITNGETVIQKGGKIGPNLYGVIGRAPGTLDFRYSKSLLAAGEAGLVWTEALIMEFVADPSAFLKKFNDDSKARSKMALKLKKGGGDVAAYLASVGPPVTQ